MKSKLNLAILASIFFPLISISEELSDVLKDAYKFYPDIEKSKTELKISEKDIDNSLSEIAEKHERFTPLKTKRKTKIGDLVLFDYEGKIDNKGFNGSSGKDETVVLGSNKYIPGYEDQMVNLEIGEQL